MTSAALFFHNKLYHGQVIVSDDDDVASCHRMSHEDSIFEPTVEHAHDPMDGYNVDTGEPETWWFVTSLASRPPFSSERPENEGEILGAAITRGKGLADAVARLYDDHGVNLPGDVDGCALGEQYVPPAFANRLMEPEEFAEGGPLNQALEEARAGGSAE